MKGLRIAAVTDPGPGFPAPDAAMAAALEAGLDVLRGLGATIVATRLPVPADECFALSRFIGPPESASIHEAEYRTDAALMGTALRDKMHGGTLQRAADYNAAQRRRRAVAEGIDGLLSGFDAPVTLGTFRVAPRLDRQDEMVAFTVETAMTPFNLSGHPSSSSAPASRRPSCRSPGRSSAPLRRGDHPRGRRAYEAATPWRKNRAPVR